MRVPAAVSNALQLVWFKRDLRVDDHAPLVTAAARGPVLPLYVIEPDYWQLPDTSQRQQDFTAECLRDLSQALAARGAPLRIETGDVNAVLDALHRHYLFEAIHAHEETGNGWTFARDRAVRSWARERGIAFFEYPQFGVVRGLSNRDGWAKQWEAYMGEPILPAPDRLSSVADCSSNTPVSFDEAPCADSRACPARQPGGVQAGEAVLNSFLNERGIGYRGGISSPLMAENAGSRLSPHIAYGSLSLRRIVHATRARRAQAREQGETRLVQSLTQFDRRLHWHCHFIQKLEQRPDIECHNVHRGFDGMREDDFDEDRFRAWSEGRTGYPMVDACMRFLMHTGWLNFRMRALLMSFASYHLWLHWRPTSLHLARLFTDYEPGIHYNQCQMQSGTTGINIPRMYNPVKQAQDHDPDGVFVRRWVPELSGLEPDQCFEPWRVGLSERKALGAADYPEPVVDYRAAARQARERLTAYRRQPNFKQQSQQVQQQLGSRRAARSTRKTKDRRQASLF
ncbi:MAG: FAD-binding domain-containing protein [Pseudomonadota bacterium]